MNRIVHIFKGNERRSTDIPYRQKVKTNGRQVGRTGPADHFLIRVRSASFVRNGHTAIYPLRVLSKWVNLLRDDSTEKITQKPSTFQTENHITKLTKPESGPVTVGHSCAFTKYTSSEMFLSTSEVRTASVQLHQPGQDDRTSVIMRPFLIRAGSVFSAMRRSDVSISKKRWFFLRVVSGVDDRLKSLKPNPTFEQDEKRKRFAHLRFFAFHN